MNEENKSAVRTDNIVTINVIEDRILGLEARIEELESKVEELLSSTANLDDTERIAKEAMYLHG